MAITPIISGTVPNQLTMQNTPIDPFATVLITTNPGGTDTLTLDLTSTGGAAGTLSGGGVTLVSPGDYKIIAPAAAIQADLNAVSFLPAAGTPSTGVTTTFDLQDTSSADPTPSLIDKTTTVSTVIFPTISGTVGGQTTTSTTAKSTPVDPFTGVTIADQNPTLPNPTETLTIQLSDGGLTGKLTGPSLTGGVGGKYEITGLSPGATTADLRNVVFTPTVGAPAGSVTATTFTLTVVSDAPTFKTPSSPANSDTTVTNTVPTNTILFQNTDGQPSFWQLNGTSVIGTGPVTALGHPTVPLNPGANWTAVGTGDFYGTSDSDILWQNSNGQVATWQMNGNNQLSAGLTTDLGAPVNPGTSWKAIGTGNFTNTAPAAADSDILLQNTGGDVAIWDMSGSAIIGSGLATLGGATASPGPNWHAIGSGDFLHSTFSDGILLQNASTSQVAIWNMGGADGTTVDTSGLATLAGATAAPGPSWEVVGTGDFVTGGDKSDIILQNSATSQVAIWDMGGTNGTSIIGSGLANVGGVTATPGLGWKVIGSGGVGDSDILLQNTTSGQTATWHMGGTDGNTIESSGMTSLNPGPNMKAVSMT
jgi:hypothetical protein